MKKTIITMLLGVTAAASASTIDTWDADELTTAAGTLTLPADTFTGYGNFSITAVLDATKVQTKLTSSTPAQLLLTANGTITTTTTDEDGNENTTTATCKLNVGLNGYSGNTNDGFYGGNTNSYSSGFGADVSQKLGADLNAGTTYSHVAITMVIGDGNLNCFVSAVKADGTIVNYDGTALSGQRYDLDEWTTITYDTTGYIKYIALDNTYLNASDAHAANAKALSAVPEPATASLSLLALAALAARRRRKGH